MSQHQPTQSKNYKLVVDQVKHTTPLIIIDMIARLIDRADEAKTRIEKEGAVVRDMKGSVIPHPGIDIESKAIKQISDLIFTHRKR